MTAQNLKLDKNHNIFQTTRFNHTMIFLWLKRIVWKMLLITTLQLQGCKVIFLHDSNKNLFYKPHENVSVSPIKNTFVFTTFLTVNFVVCNMQQNQISLILLDVAGINNSRFKDNREKTFWNTFSETSIIQPIIFFEPIYWAKKKNVLDYFLKHFHWKLAQITNTICLKQILKIQLQYGKTIIW